jgi:protein SCO1/2
MFRADRPISIFAASAFRRGAGRCTATLAVLLTLSMVVASAPAQLILERDQVRELQGVDLVERLGSSVPMDASFTNAAGESVILADYFNDGKPAILALVYYDCPVICTIVLDKLVDSLNRLDYTVGEDYRLLVVSFDHTESTTQAFGQKLRFLRHYQRAGRSEIDEAIAYHTGDETSIQRLTEAVGFKFKPMPNGEWSHASGLTILSPEGKVTRYLYGYDYPADQLKLSLLDATEGKIAKSLGERIMHFCFRYDPTAGAYSVHAMALMRLAGAVTVVLLIVLISALFIGERIRRRVRSGVTPKSSVSSKAQAVGDDRGSSPPERFSPKPAGQVS